MKKKLIRLFLVLIFFLGLSSHGVLGKDQTQNFSKGKSGLKSEISAPQKFNFIENKGQINDQINYHIKMPHGNVLFADGYIDYQFIIRNPKKNSSADFKLIDRKVRDETVSLENVRLRFLNTNPSVKVRGAQASQAVFNFYKGNDPSKWVEGAASYRKIVYEELWPHIDLVVFEHQGKLKHEYVVRPGGNINDIRFAYQGVESMVINEKGQLEINTRSRILKEDVPVSYQKIEEKKSFVATQFRIYDGNSIGFDVDVFNPAKELIIDPFLIYSTFLGGSKYDSCQDIVIDLHLNAYVVGYTTSINFPTNPGAFDKVLNDRDAFLSKLDSTGANLLFSTYYGGSDSETGSSIRYSWGDDGPVIAGSTSSSDLPTHANAYDKRLNGSSDVFVAKFTSSGQFRYATYLGGNDSEQGKIGIDGSDNIFVAGLTDSTDFVTTPGVIDDQFNSHSNIFVTKFNPQLSSLGYSTFFGEDGLYFGGITVDFNGNAFIIGDHYDKWGSWGPKIPTTPGVYMETIQDWGGSFLAKINPSGTSLVFSTYTAEGGGADEVEVYSLGIDVDGSGSVYIVGFGECDFLPGWGAYLKKFNADGSALLYQKGFLDGDYWLTFTSPGDVAVDGRGGVYVVGETNAENFHVTEDAFQSTLAGGDDSFIVKLDANNGNTQYSTYFGGSGYDNCSGIAADSFGAIYIAGGTSSPDFPTTPDSYSMNYQGDGDGFVARIRDGGPEGKLKLNKDSLLFKAPYQTAVSRKRNIKVSNNGKGTVNYNIYTDQKWLSVSPDSGDVRKETDSIAVTVTSTKKMKPGTHLGTVKVYSIDAYNSPQNMLVKLKIKGPAIKLNKKKFSVTAEEGGENPDPLVFLIRNSGPGKLRYRIQAIDSWLSTSRKQGVSTGEKDKIKIFVDITGMTSGTYTSTIEITAKGSVDPPEEIEVELTITE